MKKLLTVTLVFVFSLALVLAVGCAQKEEQPATEGGMESGMESGMEQTMPSEEGATMADSAAAMGTTETPAAEGGEGGQ